MLRHERGKGADPTLVRRAMFAVPGVVVGERPTWRRSRSALATYRP